MDCGALRRGLAGVYLKRLKGYCVCSPPRSISFLRGRNGSKDELKLSLLFPKEAFRGH